MHEYMAPLGTISGERVAGLRGKGIEFQPIICRGCIAFIHVA